MRLFALSDSAQLGAAVAAAAGIELSPLEEREFEDGEHKSRPLVSVRGEDVYVLSSLHGGRVHSPADKLLRLIFLAATCRDNGAGRTTLLVPYMAFMRKEQQTKPRDPVTSRYVAAMIDAIQPDMVVALDVHNPAAFQNAFRCRTTHLTMAETFARTVAQVPGGSHMAFLSPDSGGMRRTHQLMRAYCAGGARTAGLAMMEKHRSEGRVTGDLFAGSVEGCDVVIVDDLISTGGTILRAARACRARGASSVTALATHGLFSSASAELFDDASVDRVIVSDTAMPFGVSPEPAAGRLQVVSCAPLLASAMQRLHGAGSINRLLNPVR